MPHYRATVETSHDAAAAFDYMAHFDNTREWDPGVRSARQVSGGPVGVGTSFDLDFAIGPRTTKLVYEITEYDRPAAVTLVADNGWLRSVDRIEVTATSSGAAITYDATITLHGPLRLAHPLLAIGFKRSADKALAGLRRVLPS